MGICRICYRGCIARTANSVQTVSAASVVMHSLAIAALAKVAIKTLENPEKTCAVFKRDLDKIIELRDLNTYDSDDNLMNDICNQLPETAKGILDQNLLQFKVQNARLSNQKSFSIDHKRLL